MFKIFCSSKALPIICNPNGYPLASWPAGIEIPGKPAKLTGTVNEYCVKQAIKTGIGLQAKINKRSVFDRKNYF